MLHRIEGERLIYSKYDPPPATGDERATANMLDALHLDMDAAKLDQYRLQARELVSKEREAIRTVAGALLALHKLDAAMIAALLT